MLDLKTLLRIPREAKISMKKDSEGETIQRKSSKFFFFLLFNILPLIIGAISYCSGVIISEIDSYIGTVISIFTGLFFSLLLSIGDKIRNEKSNIDRDNSNFQKYKENMKQISNIILYIILLGVEIFILLFLNSILGKYMDGYIEIAITLLVSYILARFVISLLFVVQRFYYTSRDEINNIL
ncbi:MAG: hypothetical protein GX102_08350 [Porphyromonadaceae bacterium]|jgi:uncharacterized membrane protein (DUF485 family)|nr:hypothetical protein [Porphyromonadaceae bacterium]